MPTPINHFPANVWTRIWVIGQYIDMSGAPMKGRVTFTANVNPRRLIDRTNRLIISTAVFSADLDPNGYFEVQLPAGDDPDLVPSGWNYSVTDPLGSYLIDVPIGTPLYPVAGHRLEGEQVIDLYDVAPAATPATGTVQLLRGVGIASTTIDANRHLIVTYTDGTTQDAGLTGGVTASEVETALQPYATKLYVDTAVTGGSLDAVQELVDNAVAAHRDNPTPHPVYDDLPSLTLLFQSRLV